MAKNRLELDVVGNDKTAPAAASAKANFRSIEQEAARAAASASRGLSQLERQVAAYERRNATAGLRGLDKIRAQSQALIRAAGDDERAIQRINRATQAAEKNYQRYAMATREVAKAAPVVETTADRLDRIGNSLSMVGMRATLISAPLALGARQAILLSSALEQARIGFTSMLGSAARADAFIGKLQNFAVRTPFQFGTLVEQSRFLLASGYQERDILPALNAFGNAVAAGGGGDEMLQRVLLQVGQIRATGRATLVDLKPIAQAGVPVFDILANAIKKPGQSQQDALESVRQGLEGGRFGAIPTLNLLQRELMTRYAGNLEKQSLTTGGQLSNLKDKADLAFAAIGDSMAPTAKKYIAGAASIIEKTREMAVWFGMLPQPVKDAFVTIGAAGVAAGPALLFLGSMASLAGPAIRGVQMLRAAWVAMAGVSMFSSVGGPTLLVSAMQGPMTQGTAVAFGFAKAIGAIAAAFAGWTAGRWIQDVTGIGDAVNRFWEPVVSRFGFTTQRVAGQKSDADAAKENKFFVEKYRAGLARKGMKNIPAQGEMSDELYIGVLRDLAKTFEGDQALLKETASKERQAKLKSALESANDYLTRERIQAASPVARPGLELEDRLNKLRSDGTLTPETRRLNQLAASTDMKREVDKLRKEAAKTAADEAEEFRQAANETRNEKFRQAQEYERETEQLRLDSLDKQLGLEADYLTRSRDAQLRALEFVQADSLNEKVAMEEAKLAIEVDYLQRQGVLQIEEIRRRQERDVEYLEFRKRLYPAEAAAINERIDAVNAAAGADAQGVADKTAGEVIAARETAELRKIQLQRDETRRTFDTLKQSASGIFDALFSRTQSFGDALKNIVKTAILTPIKEILASQTAALLTRLLTGQTVTFTGTNTGGRFGAIRETLGRLGLGTPRVGGGINDVKLVNNAVPVMVMNAAPAGGNSVQQAIRRAGGGLSGLGALAATGILGVGLAGASPAGGTAVDAAITYAGGATEYVGFGAGNAASAIGPGGTSGFAGPVTGAGSSPIGGAGGLAALGKSPLGWLRGLGNIGMPKLGPGSTGGAMAGTKGIGGAAGGALLLGGGILAADGWRRGGVAGMLEMTAGGALIGAKFGGPVGAAIGAAVGFGAGMLRMMVKSAEEKAREKIKTAYGIDVREKGILKQIVAISKQSFGGDIDTAIRSQQVRELLELYSMSTGQNMGVQARVRVRGASLSQTGAGLVQNAIYENGRALAFAGINSRAPGALTIPGNPGGAGYATNYGGPGQVNVTLALNPAQTLDVFAGKTLQTVAANPRVVQSASLDAQRSNYGRREAAVQQQGRGELLK